MANNSKNGQSKTEDKNKNKGNAAAQKPQGSKQPTPAVDNIPTVTTEEVQTPLLSNAARKKEEVLRTMSPDSKVQLAGLMQERYIRNQDASIKYGQKFIDEVDNLIDATVVMAVLDLREEAISKGVDVNMVFKNGVKAFAVVEACKMLGISLPAPKLLTDGQASLEFKDATVDETVQAALDNETKVRKALEEKIPELDPSKMTTDDELKAALEYQMRSSQNGLKSLFNTIVWLRGYMNFKAKTEEDKKKYAEYTTGQWVEEILSHIKPTLVFNGLGRAVYVNAVQDGTPITAHCTVRKNVLDSDGKPILDESEIADLVKTLLKANAKFILAKEPEAMKGKTIADDKALANLMTGSETLIETILKKETDLDKKIYSMVLKQYYPNPSGDMSKKMHVKLGQIMNLYLPISERMDAYPEMEAEQDYPTTTETPAAEEKKN